MESVLSHMKSDSCAIGANIIGAYDGSALEPVSETFGILILPQLGFDLRDHPRQRPFVFLLNVSLTDIKRIRIRVVS